MVRVERKSVSSAQAIAQKVSLNLMYLICLELKTLTNQMVTTQHMPGGRNENLHCIESYLELPHREIPKRIRFPPNDDGFYFLVSLSVVHAFTVMRMETIKSKDKRNLSNANQMVSFSNIMTY